MKCLWHILHRLLFTTKSVQPNAIFSQLSDMDKRYPIHLLRLPHPLLYHLRRHDHHQHYEDQMTHGHRYQHHYHSFHHLQHHCSCGDRYI